MKRSSVSPLRRVSSNFRTFAEPLPSTTSSSALPVDGALPPPCENGQYHGTLAHPREWRGRPNKRNWRRGVAARPGFSPSPNTGALLVNGFEQRTRGHGDARDSVVTPFATVSLKLGKRRALQDASGNSVTFRTRSRSVFPSWTSRVRFPSPAPKSPRINRLQPSLLLGEIP